MLTTTLLITGVLFGGACGLIVQRQLKKRKKERFVYKFDETILSLNAWDNSAIEQIAQHIKDKGIGVVIVRKKSSLHKVCDKVAVTIPEITVLFDGVSGVLLPLDKNKNEDWSSMIRIKVQSTVDELPNLFIVSSDGRFVQVESENK